MLTKCKNCKYHDDFSWVCFNGESEHRGDFTDDDDSCYLFERKDNNTEQKKTIVDK